jgi:hypothetical protein
MRIGCLCRWSISLAALAFVALTVGSSEAQVLRTGSGWTGSEWGNTAAAASSGASARTVAGANSGCFAQAAAAGRVLRFASVPKGTGGLATLTIRRYRHPVVLAQAPACAPTVVVGHTYRVSLRYRTSTASTELEAFTHTARGWGSWYVLSRKLKRTHGLTAVTVLLRPIPGLVDRLDVGLVLKGAGSFQISRISIVDATVHSPAASVSSASPPVVTSHPEPSEGEPANPAASKGSWTVLEDIAGARTVHAILLQNGKLLLMAGSGNSRMEFEGGRFRSFIYDPVANTWKELATPKDVFCSGHVQLADGNVLILGGTNAYPAPPKAGELPSTEYKGENASWIFNIRSEKYVSVKYNEGSPNQPAEPGPMLNGAWYPSATELGNGDVISFGGLNEKGVGATSTNYFIGPYNKENKGDLPGQWAGWASEVQQTYPWFWGLYPSMILTADGRLFYDGSHVFGKGIEEEPEALYGSSIYDFYCTPGKSEAEEIKEKKEPNANVKVKGPNGEFPRVQQIKGLEHPDQRDQSASLLLPPAQSQKVMIMGGGNTYEANADATSSTQEINLGEASPEWKQGPELPAGETETGAMEGMGQGKMYVSAVALPDGNVLETGGSLHPRTDNVHEAAIFDPSTNAFTPVASDPVGRNYHSEALLLPDGRVLALGSNPANPATGEESFETRISVYSPPYLFKGARPVLDTIDGFVSHLNGSINETAQWEYGSEHMLTYSSSSPITSAVLVRPAAVTHSSDPNQREVALPITQNAGTGELKVSLTSNDNIAPPGYYMVFLVNASGVPSVAQWVHVGPQGAP